MFNFFPVIISGCHSLHTLSQTNTHTRACIPLPVVQHMPKHNAYMWPHIYMCTHLHVVGHTRVYLFGVVQIYLWGGGFIASLSDPESCPRLGSDEVSFSCPSMGEKAGGLFLFLT